MHFVEWCDIGNSGRCVIVTVGTKYLPATADDLADIRKSLDVIQKTGADLITHHAVKFSVRVRKKNEFLHFAIGDEENLATSDDIKALQDEIASAILEMRPIVVDHRVKCTKVKLK